MHRLGGAWPGGLSTAWAEPQLPRRRFSTVLEPTRSRHAGRHPVGSPFREASLSSAPVSKGRGWERGEAGETNGGWGQKWPWWQMNWGSWVRAAVLVSWGWGNGPPHTGGPEAPEPFSCGSGGLRSTSGGAKAGLPQKAAGQTSSLPLLASGVAKSFLVCTSSCSCVCLCPQTPPSYRDTVIPD